MDFKGKASTLKAGYVSLDVVAFALKFTEWLSCCVKPGVINDFKWEWSFMGHIFDLVIKPSYFFSFLLRT